MATESFDIFSDGLTSIDTLGQSCVGKPSEIDYKKIFKSAAWINNQRLQVNKSLGLSVITPDVDYSYNYSGEVKGNVTAPNGYGLVNTSPITVTSPYPIPENYIGSISGVVSGVVSGSSHQIKAYLKTSTEVLQSTVAVASNGSWSVTATGLSGIWVFKLFVISTGLQSGESWVGFNLTNYVNLKIKLFNTVDTDVLINENLVFSDLRFSFLSVPLGNKKIQIVDTTNNNVIAQWSSKSLLVRSFKFASTDVGYYNTPYETKCYLYDQALSIISLLDSGFDLESQELVQGLIQSQHTSGAFPFSTVHTNAQGYTSEPVFRSFTTAWCIEALNFWYKNVQNTTLDKNLVFNSIKKASDYLINLQNTVVNSIQYGSILGGTGRYVSNIWQNYTITQSYTSDNLISWWAFKNAFEVTKDSRYLTAKNIIEDALINRFWNFANRRFNQGIIDSLTVDTTDSLEVQSLGVYFLNAINQYQRRNDVLQRTNSYRIDLTSPNISGWKPYLLSTNLWCEGSFEVVLGYYRTGQNTFYNDAISSLNNLRMIDGSYTRSVLREDTLTSLNVSSIASTAWYVLITKTANKLFYSPSPCDLITNVNEEIYPPLAIQPSENLIQMLKVWDTEAIQIKKEIEKFVLLQDINTIRDDFVDYLSYTIGFNQFDISLKEQQKRNILQVVPYALDFKGLYNSARKLFTSIFQYGEIRESYKYIINTPPVGLGEFFNTTYPSILTSNQKSDIAENLPISSFTASDLYKQPVEVQLITKINEDEARKYILTLYNQYLDIETKLKTNSSFNSLMITYSPFFYREYANTYKLGTPVFNTYGRTSFIDLEVSSLLSRVKYETYPQIINDPTLFIMNEVKPVAVEYKLVDNKFHHEELIYNYAQDEFTEIVGQSTLPITFSSVGSWSFPLGYGRVSERLNDEGATPLFWYLQFKTFFVA